MKNKSNTLKSRIRISLAAMLLTGCPLSLAAEKDAFSEVEALLQSHQVLQSHFGQPVILARLDEAPLATGLRIEQTLLPGRAIEEWRDQVALARRILQLAPTPPTLYTLSIDYADGKEVRIPVRYGESIHDFHRVQTVGPMLWAPYHRKVEEHPSGTASVVYTMAIPNPRPGVGIVQLTAIPPEDSFRDYGTVHITRLQMDTTPASGRILVVNRKPTGDDANAGSFDAPYGTIQKAIDEARSGDTILVRGGYYAVDENIRIYKGGTEGAPLTLSAFPGESPVIDGYGVHFDQTRIQRDYPANIGQGASQMDTGIVSIFGDVSHVRVRGLGIQNSRRAGISYYGGREGDSTWASTRDLEVAFNRIYKTFSMGIILHVVNDVRVIGNEVIRPHSTQMASDLRTGVPRMHEHQPQEGIDLSRNKGFEIAFNVVGGGGKEAIDCISVEDGHIHHNYVFNSLNGIYIDSWSIPIRNLRIDRNFIHDSYAGIPLATEGSNDLENFVIHNNIVIDSKNVGIAVTEATYKANPSKVRNHQVFNNTVHRAGRHATNIGWEAYGIQVKGFPDNPNFTDVDVRDNIVTDSYGLPLQNQYADSPIDHRIRFTHNLIYPDPGNAYVGEAALISNPLYVDPMRGDFRLRDGSPAIGAGVSGGDLGALPFGTAWLPGRDFAGQVTAYHSGDMLWKPVYIPRDKFTIHRNHVQQPSWFQIGRYGNDFQNIPGGDLSLGGIRWFLPEDENAVDPSVVALRGFGSQADLDAVTGIPVNATVDQLAFLHAYHINNRVNTAPGSLLFVYRVHYGDGSSIDIPVHWEKEIANWYFQRNDMRAGDPEWLRKHPEATADLPGARLVHAEEIRRRRELRGLQRLYALVWDNPRPEVVITAVDMINRADYEAGAPALFSISKGNRLR